MISVLCWPRRINFRKNEGLGMTRGRKGVSYFVLSFFFGFDS